eukprot:scaffold118979_cov39-Phaeocystis_antarctica.AAC.1
MLCRFSSYELVHIRVATGMGSYNGSIGRHAVSTDAALIRVCLAYVDLQPMWQAMTLVVTLCADVDVDADADADADVDISMARAAIPNMAALTTAILPLAILTMALLTMAAGGG